MLTSKPYNKVSKADVKIFRQTIEKSKIINKDEQTHYHPKQAKFLRYHIILEARFSASDKLFYNPRNQKTIKQMQSGKILPQAELDLHGQNLEESCISMAKFIAYHQNKDYLHIIHGKGYNSKDMSKLKTQVYNYLKAHPQISAFCSCAPGFGGTGAVIAKLK